MFFKGIETLEQLRKAYRELAMAHHPDHGGDVKTMQAINAEYQRLVKILPDIPEPDLAAGNAGKPDSGRPCNPGLRSYRRTTAGGANPGRVRLASPRLSHELVCQIVKTLFLYGDWQGEIREFYRRVCDAIDPGQARGYQDYVFNRKIAKSSLKFLQEKIFPQFCTGELIALAKTARARLA
ncbi:MAG: J domain-containing protein [Desulfovibrio sp.]|nr:J domain-containing protein [Desulfovibrio sp.]